MGTRRFHVAVLVSIVAGCSSSGSTRSGNLGHGTFNYKCVDQSDAACKTATITTGPLAGPAEFPGAIAEGAQFRMAYVIKPGDETLAGNPTLRVVSNVYLTKESDTFTALKSGFGAVVAKSTTTGQVIDYTLIKINPVGSLRLSDPGGGLPPPTVTLARGVTTEYVVEALGLHGETLDGTLGYKWDTSDATVVTLQMGNPTARMKVLASKAGTATLTVTLGTQSKLLSITVTP